MGAKNEHWGRKRLKSIKVTQLIVLCAPIGLLSVLATPCPGQPWASGLFRPPEPWSWNTMVFGTKPLLRGFKVVMKLSGPVCRPHMPFGI